MDQVPVLLPEEERLSRDGSVLSGVDGRPLVRVSEAPPLLVGQVLRRMRATCGDVDPDELLGVLAEAGRLFAAATLGGETPGEYQRRHALATGLPIAVSRAALTRMAADLARVGEVLRQQRPAGVDAVPGRTPAARWVARGRVLGVLAPSNHPMVHRAWLEGIALGYQVALRPGSRDPFTPVRLARALREAGLPGDRLAVLPGPHASAQALLREADLGLVYGTDAAVAPYRDRNRYLIRGPGRTKALVCGGEPDDATYDALVRAVADDGGVRCTNVSAVLVEGDHGTVAEELARRLAALPVLPVLDPGARLPVRSAADAAALRGSFSAMPEGAVDVSAAVGQSPLTPLDDGSAVLRPAVVRVDRSDHPLLAAEMPFPCAVVAPLGSEDGRPEDHLAPLRNSLAVLVCGDGRLITRRLLDEPSIRTVVLGAVPDWSSDPALPHDGYLSQFLMEARGIVHGGAR